jgi:hypothetical protein
MLWGNLNNNYNQNTMGYSSETDISWISYQQREWNNPNVVGYMESHDEERLMYKNLQFGNSSGSYNVKDLNTALSRQELAGLFFFTIPGPKMIWQFGELGYDVSIDDPGRVDRKPIHWDYFNDANRKQIYNTWATLIEFKKQQPVFNTSDFPLNVSGLTKTIVLKDASMDVVLVGNFDVTEKTITTSFSQTGTWFEYFTGTENNFSNTSQSLTLKPGEYRLYSTVKLLDPRGGTANDDSDNDNVIDTVDLCPNTMEGTTVNATGCPIFNLPSNNFEIIVTSETCPTKDNGQINITANSTQTYEVTIVGTLGFTDTQAFTDNSSFDNLVPDFYDVCIGVTGESYEQCFVVAIKEGTTVEGKSSIVSGKSSIEIAEGTAPFTIYVNGEETFTTASSLFSVDVKHGDLIEVKTAVSCEGVYSKTVELLEGIIAYPNPSNGIFEISLPVSQKEVIIELYNIQSQLISIKTYPILYGKVRLNIGNQPAGMYIARVQLNSPIILKIIKQ